MSQAALNLDQLRLVDWQHELGREITVDNFCGGGGASTGIRNALNREVDIAINHDPSAIGMHTANHPNTEHYLESVWDVDPVKAVRGRKVGYAWFSPDCTHFSKAKGSKPKSKNIRGLAWVSVKWGGLVRPRVMVLENVEEFTTWGPLDENDRPIESRKGETFDAFKMALTTGLPEEHPSFDEIRSALGEDFPYEKIVTGLGYDIDFKMLAACDYGAPTRRVRFFMIARSDGKPIVWPKATHGDPMSLPVQSGHQMPWRTAAEHIDFSIPVKSIFNRSKPLCENTLKRIARGFKKFIVDNPSPYIVDGKVNFISQYYGENGTDDARGQTLDSPLYTITTANRYALVSAFIAKHYGGNYTGCGQALDAPLPTITTKDHSTLVCAYMIAYYGQEKDIGSKVDEPLRTITTKDRFALVLTIHGQEYEVVDIGMRFLTPRELYSCQGFDESYIIDRDHKGNPLKAQVQKQKVGNSVCPPIAEAITRANVPELRTYNTKIA